MSSSALSGLWAVVRAAVRGIGAAVPAHFALPGAHVVVGDMDAEGTAQTAERIDGDTAVADTSLTTDLADLGHEPTFW